MLKALAQTVAILAAIGAVLGFSTIMDMPVSKGTAMVTFYLVIPAALGVALGLLGVWLIRAVQRAR